MVRPTLGIALLTAVACAAPRPEPKRVEVDEDVGEFPNAPPRPRPPRPRTVDVATDGSFRGLFPNNPMPVTASGIRREAIAPDQRGPAPNNGDTRSAELHFDAAGIYVDPEQVPHLGLVPSRAWRNATDRDEPTMDVVWFDVTTTSSPLPWRVWHARHGGGTVLAYESKGEIIALRYVAEVQRVRPLAIDPRLPMVLVETASEDARSYAQVDYVIGFHDTSLVELLMIDVRTAAIALRGKSIIKREIPELQAACAPDQLVDTGCASEMVTYTWTGDTFDESEPVTNRVRLVEQPQPTARR